MGAERFDGFVVGHTWGVGSDFVKDAAWFTEVDAVEVVAVDEFGGAHSGGDEFFAPSGVVGIVLGAEGNVVDDSGAHPTDLDLGLGEFDSVGDLGRAAEEFDLVFFGFEDIAHRLGEEFLGAVGADRCELNAVEAVDGDFGGGVVPSDLGIRGLDGFDEFDLEAVVVLKSEKGEIEALFGGEGDAGFGEASDPVIGGVFGDGEGEAGGLAEANCALGALRPGEKGDEGAGGTLGVAVVEVIGAGVVVVDGDFDEAKAEDPRVEVDVALGITAHGGDVVDA